MASGDEPDWMFPLPRVAVAVEMGGLFPVRRVYCVGRNYADHAIEMGADPASEPPFFFQKPADAIQQAGADGIVENPYPPMTEDYQPEVELVVALKRGGTNILEKDALTHVFGFAVGFDMTRRDRQAEAKQGRRPWEIAKSFDHAAPIGIIRTVEQVGPMAEGDITLDVNGERRQAGDLSSMILGVPALIAQLSKSGALAAGDIVFTGTPAGVAPVRRGDELVGRIAGLPELRVRIV